MPPKIRARQASRQRPRSGSVRALARGTGRFRGLRALIGPISLAPAASSTAPPSADATIAPPGSSATVRQCASPRPSILRLAFLFALPLPGWSNWPNLRADRVASGPPMGNGTAWHGMFVAAAAFAGAPLATRKTSVELSLSPCGNVTAASSALTGRGLVPAQHNTAQNNARRDSPHSTMLPGVSLPSNAPHNKQESEPSAISAALRSNHHDPLMRPVIRLAPDHEMSCLSGTEITSRLPASGTTDTRHGTRQRLVGDCTNPLLHSAPLIHNWNCAPS